MKYLACCILLMAHKIEFDFNSQWIVWNVGQGLFSTLVLPDKCLHMDFGGERFPMSVKKVCRTRSNILFLSHEHRDHYAFASQMTQLRSVCRTFLTRITKLQNIPKCSQKPKDVQTLFNREIFDDKNSNSRVYIYKAKILFPGDSLQKAEKIWAPLLPPNLKYWVLAHHGSRTSTSLDFLKNLSAVRMAVVSARFKKYGHPHRSVLERLRIKKIPVLKTQDWGHIRIQLAI